MSKAFLFIIYIFAFLFCSVVQAETIEQKLKRFERDIIDLQKVIFNEKNNSKLIDNNKQKISSEITVFDMRLRDIENELQSITLNYENISFEIEDLKNVLEELTIKLNNVIVTKQNVSESEISSDNEKQNITESDTLVAESNTLGELKINSNDLSDSQKNKINEEKIINEISPEQKFQIAFDQLRSQNFENAKRSLENFITDYPSNQLSGSAYYWLGEIHLLNNEYRQAALVFAEGYQKYPKSVKAPASLYKLAHSLVEIEKKDDACDTLNQFLSKYPNHKLEDKTKSKIISLQCS